MERQVVDTRELAVAIGVGYTTARALVSTGEIASLRIGTRRLILADDVREFLSRRRAESERIAL